MPRAEGLYRQYKHEFEMLESNGCRLYCPAGVKVRPKQLASVMVRDRSATYMRDMIYDRKGKVVKVNFTRVPIQTDEKDEEDLRKTRRHKKE